ncbi:predicted protein [Nematostella vectensis]|uniref:MKRN2 opposite strand protein n=1 Tax=Nematostella vectensis TaxID=45351 RepID=A7RU96_NEMVE|nr:predicted protein [Nematostella vectensis]|eukprot:XP_001637107.1 predicted protein [Nematostella vectensis]
MSPTEHSLMCMQHCSSDSYLIFTTFPRSCEVCGSVLENCRLRVPPFRLPNPFVASRCVPRSVLIRPTRGDFLSDYQNGDNLHIGISDENGSVYHYDERGANIDTCGWDQCVVVEIQNRSHIEDKWREILHSSQLSDLWTSERYDETSHNCYDYVLNVIRQLLFVTAPKQDFCRQFILPVTTKIAKYLEMYRKVKIRGVVVTQSLS